MTPAKPLTYDVQAYNLSHASENKIHDDAVAQKLGFSGGLVPGVEVFGYMTHPVVARWGRAWLEHGRMDGRFAKPLYDGRTAHITGTEGADGAMAIALSSDGIDCAHATASLPPRTIAPVLSSYAEALPPAERPPADETSLAEGTALGITPYVLTAERHRDYLRDVRETHALYAQAGLLHPGHLLRLCNLLLRENVVLAPWIHTGSVVQNHATAGVDDTLTARARVTRNWEHKGHRLVALDAVVVSNNATVIAHVAHTAVYKLRHLS